MHYPSKTFTALGTLIGLIVLPTLLSGCKFGNKDTTTLTGFDTISGYYLSLPQTISFDATLTTGSPRTHDGQVNEMPDLLKTVMANPTLLVFDDPIGGLGSIRSRQQTSTGFYTMIDSAAGTFGAADEVSATVSGCQFVKTVTTSGKFSQLMSQQQVAGVWARGKIALDYDVVFETLGEDSDCVTLRTNFMNCFVNGTGCSSDSGSVYYTGLIDEMFTPFVNSGLITGSEIATTKKLHYHAAYQ